MKMYIEQRKVVLFVLLLFLLLRIGIVIVTGQKESDFSDAHSYNKYAHTILKSDNWLTNPDFPGNYRAPLYPILIAIVYFLCGINNFYAVYIFQSIVSVLTCFYIYKFSRKLFNEKVSLIILIWSGIYIPYLRYVGALIRETLIFFLLFVFLYYIYLYLTKEEKRTQHFCLSSIFYFLLIHLDARYIFYLPFLSILFVIYRPFWEGVKKYAIFLGISILLMIPWSIRNYIAYDGLVIINTKGLDLRKSTDISYNRPSHFWRKTLKIGTVNESVNDDFISEDERTLLKQGLNPKNRSLDEIEAVKNDIYPASSYLGRKFYWMIHFWRPFKFSGDFFPYPSGKFNKWSLKHNLANILCYGLLLPFLIIGAYLLIKKRKKFIIFLVFPLVIQTLLHVLLWGRERYRHPIDAFIIILGIYGFYSLIMGVKKYLKGGYGNEFTVNSNPRI